MLGSSRALSERVPMLSLHCVFQSIWDAGECPSGLRKAPDVDLIKWFHRLLRVFHAIPCLSMLFNYIPWHYVTRYSMLSHCSPWLVYSMLFHYIPCHYIACYSMLVHAIQLYPMALCHTLIHAIPLYPMTILFHAVPLYPMTLFQRCCPSQTMYPDGGGLDGRRSLLEDWSPSPGIQSARVRLSPARVRVVK